MKTMAVQNSINTNVGSFVALRNLNSINRKLDVTQNRVSTGLTVAGALDAASHFSIAQGIRGELKAIGAVTQGLNNARVPARSRPPAPPASPTCCKPSATT